MSAGRDIKRREGSGYSSITVAPAHKPTLLTQRRISFTELETGLDESRRAIIAHLFFPMIQYRYNV